jgi:hypothetical protein
MENKSFIIIIFITIIIIIITHKITKNSILFLIEVIIHNFLRRYHSDIDDSKHLRDGQWWVKLPDDNSIAASCLIVDVDAFLITLGEVDIKLFDRITRGQSAWRQ